MRARANKIVRFDSLEYTSIDDASSSESNNELVKIGCYIKELDKKKFNQTGENEFRFRSCVKFSESGDDEEICSLPVTQSRYNSLKRRFKIGEPIEVIGKIIKEAIPPKRKNDEIDYENRLKVLRTRSGDKPLRICHATKDEIDLVKKFLRKLKIDNVKTDKFFLLSALKNAAVAQFKISGLNKNPIYADSLEAMIIQAFSSGTVQNSNGKIHVCVIGPSSTGKKLFMHTGHFINFVSREAQPISLSIPGITGDCSRVKGGYNVKKGLIPMAHRGLFGIQDLDKSRIMPEVLEVLSPVMEEGKCIIAKAGKEEFVAETGIYIDINRLSDKSGDDSTRSNVFKDTSLPNHIISRFDYIAELKKDASLQFQIIKESVQNKNRPLSRHEPVSKFCRINNFPVDRFIKLVVAYITEKYAEIDTSKVDSLIAEGINRIYQANKGHIDQLQNTGQFLFRYRNSIYKFVEALTRMQMRHVSNKESVDKAFQLLSRKLNFLQGLDPNLLVPKFRLSKIENFQKWIVKTYGKKKFSVKDAYEKYQKANYPAGPIKIDAFNKRIAAVAINKEHGFWVIKSKFVKKWR